MRKTLRNLFAVAMLFLAISVTTTPMRAEADTYPLGGCELPNYMFVADGNIRCILWEDGIFTCLPTGTCYIICCWPSALSNGIHYSAPWEMQPAEEPDETYSNPIRFLPRKFETGKFWLL